MRKILIIVKKGINLFSIKLYQNLNKKWIKICKNGFIYLDFEMLNTI